VVDQYALPQTTSSLQATLLVLSKACQVWLIIIAVKYVKNNIISSPHT